MASIALKTWIMTSMGILIIIVAGIAIYLWYVLVPSRSSVREGKGEQSEDATIEKLEDHRRERK